MNQTLLKHSNYPSPGSLMAEYVCAEFSSIGIVQKDYDAITSALKDSSRHLVVLTGKARRLAISSVLLVGYMYANNKDANIWLPSQSYLSDMNNIFSHFTSPAVWGELRTAISRSLFHDSDTYIGRNIEVAIMEDKSRVSDYDDILNVVRRIKSRHHPNGLCIVISDEEYEDAKGTYSNDSAVIYCTDTNSLSLT